MLSAEFILTEKCRLLGQKLYNYIMSTHPYSNLISTLLILLISLCLISANAIAQSCDSGLALDWNCDGKQKVTVLGDSFVAGIGDSSIKTLHGYIGRTQKALPRIDIDGFGTKGQQTSQLLTQLKAAFNSEKSSSLLESLLLSDIVILDIGRNDRWLRGLPSVALKNLGDIRRLIKSSVEERTGVAPVVVIAVMMLPNRGDQGPWVKELDQLIFKSHSLNFPANLRFDLVSKRLIGSDQIHPTSRGYAALSKTFVYYLKKTLPGMLQKLKQA